MKLPTIFKNEINFIIKQGKTALLIILLPIILVATIAPTVTTMSVTSTTVAVLEGDASVFNQLLETPGLHVKTYPTEDAVRQAVVRGEAVLGLITYEENGVKRIRAIRDQLKSVISISTALAIENKLTEKAGEIISTQLVKGWDDLRFSNAKLAVKAEEIPSARIKNEEALQNLTSLQNQVDSLQLSQNLAAMKADVQNSKQQVTSFASLIPKYQNEVSGLSNTESELYAVGNELRQLRSDISYTSSRVSYYITVVDRNIASLDSGIAATDNAIKTVNSLRSSPYYTNAQLDAAYYALVKARNDANAARSDLIQTRNDLVQTQAKLNTYEQRIAVKTTQVDSTRQLVASKRVQFTQQLANLSYTAQATNANLDVMANKIIVMQQSASTVTGSFNAFTTNARTELRAVSGELASAETMIADARKGLESLLGVNPQDLAVPQLRPEDAIDASPFQTLLPPLISMTTLLGCLLLPLIMTMRQKTQGVEDRIRLTNTSPFSIWAGRFAGNYLTTLLQVAIIIAASLAFFSLRLPTNTGTIAVALLLPPAVFVCLGLLLSRFITKESSSILVTLLLSIPMIFLGGLILPLEFMHSPMREISQVLPLTVANSLVEGAIVRGLTLAQMSGFLEILAFYFLLFAALSIKFWNKTTAAL